METLRRIGLSLIAVLLCVAPLAAQVVAPPPPAEYDIELRYRIRAPRNQRIEQFDAMIRNLDAAGLIHDPVSDEEVADPNAERLRGRIKSSAVEAVLSEPNVLAILLVPAGAKLPDGTDARVPVRIELAAGLAPDRQRLLASQSRDRLAMLGFVEKVGYDHGDYTRLFGTIPVRVLPLLLTDLRLQPGGWLLPETEPDSLPEPLRYVSPLRVIRVVPEPADATSASDAVTPKINPALVKLSPGLLALVEDAATSGKRTRMDVILHDMPTSEDRRWRDRLNAVADMTIEGIAGQIVSVNTTVGAARNIASLPEVATVRLPVAASPPIPTPDVVQAPDALQLTNVARLQQLGGTGLGTKFAIIDSDFAGIQKFLGKSLPPKTKFIDLTAERSVNIEPDALANDRPGRGTLSALAAALAAPAGELVLIRVDDAAPYQVLTIAQAISGQLSRSESMRLRHMELLLDDTQLRENRQKLEAERTQLADNFASSDEVQKQRVELQARLKDQDRKERLYSERLARFQALEADLFELREVAVVANNLNWLDGMAADGTGPLALFLDGPAQVSHTKNKVTSPWLQSAGDTQGQSWVGHWLDNDDNGALEFATAEMPLPVRRWTRELNFIRWQPHNGSATEKLPAGAHVRLTVQWTEAHDSQASVDPLRWRTPLNTLRPAIVRQRDETGKQLSSDDLVVVARTAELPQMLGRGTGWATFEQVIEYSTDAAGVYAVRLEGRAAAATVAPEVPTIPAAKKRGEVYPRVTISVMDAPSRDAGRPIFEITGDLGGIGTPGDAHGSTVVGAANRAGQTQTYSAIGSVPSLSLVNRPRTIAPDEFNFGTIPARGTAIANGFVGGSVTAMLSAGAPPSPNLNWLFLPSGGAFVVPEAWLNQLPLGRCPAADKPLPTH